MMEPTRTALDAPSADHVFGQDRQRAGERRTLIVVLMTLIMMAIEIGAGIAYGSMALLADGLHMASHAAALGVSFIAYVFARRRAADRRFSFGTGKINALAGFAGAVLLAVFALIMAVESVERLLDPVDIRFDQAIAVAVVGLVVNAVSAVLLAGGGHDHGHGHEHGHEHEHDHDDDHTHPHGHQDHNLRAAYLHVLADALTSVLAIAALLAGRFAGLSVLDPIVGVVGAALVAHWSFGLIRDTASVLLDMQAPDHVLDDIRRAIEGGRGEDEVTDLHVWSIGPGIRSAEIVVASTNPQPARVYRSRLPASAGVVHAVVEVNRAAR